MENNTRPTFGAVDPKAAEEPKREEIGAIWKRFSNKTNSEFMSLKIAKSKLKELLDKLPETEDSLNLVAFVNRNQNGDDKRPNFRIFEELKK